MAGRAGCSATLGPVDLGPHLCVDACTHARVRLCRPGLGVNTCAGLHSASACAASSHLTAKGHGGGGRASGPNACACGKLRLPGESWGWDPALPHSPSLPNSSTPRAA